MLTLGCLGLLGEEAYLCLTHYLDQVPCAGGGDNNNDDNDNENDEDDDDFNDNDDGNDNENYEDDGDDNDNDDVDDDADQETVTDFHRERMEEHPLPRVSFSCICLFSRHFGMYLFLLKLK